MEDEEKLIREELNREMLLRMIIRCRKVRKHKPKAVRLPALKVGSLDSPLFPDSEIKNKSFRRIDTHGVRAALRQVE